MNNNDNFYPSLFKKQKKAIVIDKDKFTFPCTIPLNTYTDDDKYTIANRVEKEYITIFGYSPDNTENIIEIIKKEGNIKNIEYGRNYVNVTYENINDYNKILILNRTIINGEYIGVFRNNIMDKVQIKQQSKSMLAKILEYLFG